MSDEHDTSCEPPPTLRLEGMTEAFGIGKPAEVEVLQGIDLIARCGPFAALIGPSGSGKSALLNLIGLLDQPTRGTPFIEGRETEHLYVGALPRLHGRPVGFVFEYRQVLPEFTALQDVVQPRLAARGRADRQPRHPDRRPGVRPVARRDPEKAHGSPDRDPLRAPGASLRPHHRTRGRVHAVRHGHCSGGPSWRKCGGDGVDRLT